MIVAVTNLSHSYGSREALRNLSFEVAAGQIHGILGPNGGGKSTLFRILSTMMTPTSGSAMLAGFDVSRQPQEVRRRIGVVFQSASLDRKLTVAENLRGQGHLHGLSGADLGQRMTHALARLGLADRTNDLAGELSGGLRRRVEIAKALLHDPQVLLMDEPSAGLDPGARRELWQHVDELRREQGTTVLLTTHILDEADRCDRLALLHEGRLVAAGTPAELKARVGGDVVILEAADAPRFQGELAARFSVQPTVIDGTIRVELRDAHRFVAEVVEAFPGVIQSVSFHKPTLEDVFLDETGVSIGR